jgi:hypothetical protein
MQTEMPRPCVALAALFVASAAPEIAASQPS